MDSATAAAARRITINCDLGEGFGRYRLADDAEIMPLIDLANVACGFHASDPVIMAETADLAARHGAHTGAHPGLPDLQGFGRRLMRLSRHEVCCAVRYQIGALKAFLDHAGRSLHHVKPHGALYGISAREEEVAHAICDAASGHATTLLGLAGTAHEHVYTARGFAFVPEFYPDLDYDDHGMLVVGPAPRKRDATEAAKRAFHAVISGSATAASGKPITVRAESICIHSDAPDAAALIRAVRAALHAPEGS